MSSAPAATPMEPRPRFRDRLRRTWWKIRGWCASAWPLIRPGAKARRGAVWGCVVVAAIVTTITARIINLGWGLWFDFVFCFTVAALIIPLAAVLVWLLLTILRKLPRLATGFIMGSCVVVWLAFGRPQLGVPVAILVGLIEGTLGAAIATILFDNFRQAHPAKKIITITLCAATLAANIWAVTFVLRDGTVEDLMRAQAGGPQPAALTGPNPADPGPYRVRTLFYGVGNDIRRREYGLSVAIKTRTVDASKFFKDFKGWKRNLRSRYWGFDMDKLPLNARVWYPDGPGPFPLALIVHGNHLMTEFSDPGYAYLGELLASRGFILASIDENFLNGGLFHDPPKQQAVRGWMLLEHLKLWREWKDQPGNPFYRKVDFNRIALMGHSRGGEAAATATLFNQLSYYPDDATMRFDYHFPIRAVLAIAPADGQYKPAGQHRYIDNVSYFVIQGANDADVSSFSGSRQFDRVRFTTAGPWFKSELYIYRANHGQFNTVWGRSDFGHGPWSWFLNLKPLLSGEDQRRIGKVYFSAFLEATLHDRPECVDLFRDYRAIRSWLPDTLYVSRFQDASYRAIAAFNEDPDVTTTTAPGGRIAASGLSIWREDRIPFRQGDRDYNGVFIGWNRKDAKAPAPWYEISLPPRGLDLNARSAVNLSIAVLDMDAPLPDGEKKDDKKKESKQKREAPDFTLEIEASDGAVAAQPLTRFGAVPPPIKIRFTKLAKLDAEAYKKDSEPVFQSITAPLAAFGKVDPNKVAKIRLKFDRTPASVILISAIGIAQTPETGHRPLQ